MKGFATALTEYDYAMIDAMKFHMDIERYESAKQRARKELAEKFCDGIMAYSQEICHMKSADDFCEFDVVEADDVKKYFGATHKSLEV